MKIVIYIITVVGGIILTIFGSYFLGVSENITEAEQPQEQSTFLKDFNEHYSKYDSLSDEFDSLHKVWWGYYNELNFPLMKETNDRMTYLNDQMRVLTNNYKTKRHE
jgi:hypothetical protein